MVTAGFEELSEPQSYSLTPPHSLSPKEEGRKGEKGEDELWTLGKGGAGGGDKVPTVPAGCDFSSFPCLWAEDVSMGQLRGVSKVPGGEQVQHPGDLSEASQHIVWS